MKTKFDIDCSYSWDYEHELVDIWMFDDDVSMGVLEGVPVKDLPKLKRKIDHFLAHYKKEMGE